MNETENAGVAARTMPGVEEPASRQALLEELRRLRSLLNTTFLAMLLLSAAVNAWSPAVGRQDGEIISRSEGVDCKPDQHSHAQFRSALGAITGRGRGINSAGGTDKTRLLVSAMDDQIPNVGNPGECVSED